TADSIENDYYRIAAGSRGLEVTELASGQRFGLHFEDEGDRGDEYNFDPVRNSIPIATPAKFETCVTENGAVRKRMVSRFEFNIPRSLGSDRSSREASVEPLTIELNATLWTGLRRIDFEATVVNRSRDHRLRVALRTPVTAVESVSDTSFGVLRRPVE